MSRRPRKLATKEYNYWKPRGETKRRGSRRIGLEGACGCASHGGGAIRKRLRDKNVSSFGVWFGFNDNTLPARSRRGPSQPPIENENAKLS